ncbi:MAG: hypothetical protein K6F53_09465 [Lachnospiraceae bacterium]|nr:hypothetical protein [Lachnospiraceae bacterium]
MTTDDKIDRLSEKMEQLIDQLNVRMDRMDERFDRMDERFDRMDERFDRMDERFDRMDERMDRMDERMDEMQETLDEHEVRFSAEIETLHNEMKNGFKQLDERLSLVEGKVGSMDADIKLLGHTVAGMSVDLTAIDEKLGKVELRLENEICPNIQLIAEGHHMLSDKLSDAIKIRDDNLYYQVQVNTFGRKISDLEESVVEIKKEMELQKAAG